MRRKLAISVLSGSWLLVCGAIEAKAADAPLRYAQANEGRTVDLAASSVVGTRLDGTSRVTPTQWLDEKRTEVLSRLLDRPRRWSALLEDWGDHIVRRVMALGASGIWMLYMMLILSVSLVHAFPNKTTRKIRVKRVRAK